MNVTIHQQNPNVSIDSKVIGIYAEPYNKKNININIRSSKVNTSINSSNMDINVGSSIAREVIDTYPYEGEYIINPNTETQILETKNLRMLKDVVINPIPNNYGLITWNGSFLMIS